MTTVERPETATVTPIHAHGGRPVVELDGVVRTFAGPPPVHVLKAVDLRVDAGEYVSIVGPSGSGKSTLLNILGLLDRPTAGEYRLDGTDTARLDDGERTALRGQRIGFVFQSFHLLPHRTTVENVALAELYQPVPSAGRNKRAIEALRRVGLGHRLTASPSTLSGGERQRVAVARALVGSPSLLLADEPTGNLDSVTSRSILDLFDGLHDQGITLMVITHDDEVAERAQRRISIIDGRIETS